MKTKLDIFCHNLSTFGATISTDGNVLYKSKCGFIVEKYHFDNVMYKNVTSAWDKNKIK